MSATAQSPASAKPSVVQRVRKASSSIRSRWSDQEQRHRRALADTMQAQLALLLAISPQPAVAPVRSPR